MWCPKLPHYGVCWARTQDKLRPGMGVTQSRSMSRLRIKCLLLESWVDLNRKMGKDLSHKSTWINAWEIHLSHELILSQFLKSRLSHQLIRINAPSRIIPHKGQRNLVKAQKSPTKLSESPRKVDDIEWKPKKVHRNQHLIRIIESNRQTDKRGIVCVCLLTS